MSCNNKDKILDDIIDAIKERDKRRAKAIAHRVNLKINKNSIYNPKTYAQYKGKRTIDKNYSGD